MLGASVPAVHPWVIIGSASLTSLVLGAYFVVRGLEEIHDEVLTFAQGIILLLIGIAIVVFQTSSPFVFLVIAAVVLIRYLLPYLWILNGGSGEP